MKRNIIINSFVLLGLLLLLPGMATAGTVGYQYDALHRLTQVAYANGTTIDYSYDPTGNRTQKLVTALADYDGDGDPDETDLDDDDDGMPDEYEIAQGFDPMDETDAEDDADEDGFTNGEEHAWGTNPHRAASNPRASRLHIYMRSINSAM